MKRIHHSVGILVLLFSTLFCSANDTFEKKILYVNSYHTGYFWNDGIEKAIKKTLKESQLPIRFKKIEMDTKRNTSESYKLSAARKVKALIESYKPDVVIVSDDNAAKYVIVPYFYNASIPFVFCGVNGSSKKYGFPARNVTGMEEVQLIPQLIERLQKYAKGNTIGYLREDTLSSRNESDFFEEQLGVSIEKRFVTSLAQWKEEFIALQKSVDILLLGNFATLSQWESKEIDLEGFIKQNTQIPTAGWDAVLSKMVLLVFYFL